MLADWSDGYLCLSFWRGLENALYVRIMLICTNVHAGGVHGAWIVFFFGRIEVDMLGITAESNPTLYVVVELASIQQPRGSNLYISNMRISIHPLFAPVNQNGFLVYANIRNETKSLSLL